MTAASNDLEVKILKHIFTNVSTNGGAYTAPSSVFVSLHTGSPAEDNSGSNEISGSGYARQSVTFGDVATDGSNNTSVSSNATVQFPAASGNYSADVTFIGIYDAVSGGNLMFFGSLSTQKTVTTGDVFQINSGSLTITLD